MTSTEFVYTTYINTTPERLGQALTEHQRWLALSLLSNLKTLLESGETLPADDAARPNQAR